jgi:uncharacterized membrane protein HdeD (DUF308 family)
MPQVEGTGTVSSDPAKWWVIVLLGAISIAAGVLALWVVLATTEQHSEGGRVLRFFVGFLATLAGLVCWSGPAPGC